MSPHAAPYTRAVIALGSNLGERNDTLSAAVADLVDPPEVRLLAISPIVQTKAVGGPPDQPDFLNMVIAVETSLSPEDLLRHCHAVEQKHLRVREVHWGPRTLDVDIITYGDLVSSDPDLTLPHPRAAERAFVLYPVVPDRARGRAERGAGGRPCRQGRRFPGPRAVRRLRGAQGHGRSGGGAVKLISPLLLLVIGVALAVLGWARHPDDRPLRAEHPGAAADRPDHHGRDRRRHPDPGHPCAALAQRQEEENAQPDPGRVDPRPRPGLRLHRDRAAGLARRDLPGPAAAVVRAQRPIHHLGDAVHGRRRPRDGRGGPGGGAVLPDSARRTATPKGPPGCRASAASPRPKANMRTEAIDPPGVAWLRVSPRYVTVRVVGWALANVAAVAVLSLPLVLVLTGVWDWPPLWLAVALPAAALAAGPLAAGPHPAPGALHRLRRTRGRPPDPARHLLPARPGGAVRQDAVRGHRAPARWNAALGLCTLKLHTASAGTSAEIPGLPAAEGARLREQLSARGEARLAGL